MAAPSAAPITIASTLPANVRDATTAEVFYTLSTLNPSLRSAAHLQRMCRPQNSYDVELVFSSRFVAYKTWGEPNTAIVFEPGSTLTLTKAWCNQSGMVDAEDRQTEATGWSCTLPGGILFEGLYREQGTPAGSTATDGFKLEQLTLKDVMQNVHIDRNYVFRCVTFHSLLYFC